MFEDDIMGALKKCAVGLETNEVVEEFGVEDGELKLIKKKVTKRDIPPDIKAVKLLIDGGGVDGLSVEELEEEKKKLLNLLNKEDIN
ncbi:MAG: hypothetical protein K2N23_07635 [Clostridia bacterium]|nr:hypothetical protein [Clostridia bacterium]